MNSQDITRALIDTTVARAMVEMDADPKRSVRKLCDLGRQFSRGRFQNQIFAIFQDLLRNDESPYYQAAFLWFLSDTPLTEKQQKLLLSCPNLMVSLPIDAPSTASMAKALRRQKTLFGMHKVYQDADAAAYLLSFDHLYSQMEQSVFFFLVADDSCSKESIRAVSDVVQQYRFTPIQPFFPIEVQEDSRKIEQIITANPAYLLLLPDHMARTLDTPTVSFEELSLRNIFYRELLADA